MASRRAPSTRSRSWARRSAAGRAWSRRRRIRRRSAWRADTMAMDTWEDRTMTFGDSIRTLGDVLALSPENVLPAVALLAFAFLLNDLVRTWWMTQATRSVLAHVAICLLTLAP